MTPSARLSALIELLDIIENTARPADALVSAYFRQRRYIGSKDRGAVSQELYALLRHYGRLTWWLNYLKAERTGRNLAIAYLFFVIKQSRSEIEAQFNGSKYAPAALEAPENKLLRDLKGHTFSHPQMPPSLANECPEWAYDTLKQRFSKTLERELAAMLQPAPLDLRANPLNITRDEALEQLKKLDLVVKPTSYSPYGLRVMNRPALGSIALLKNGSLEIQDEGSQLVALLCEAKPGERIVDFCAGAGGKTLTLAACMENKGRITACDVLANRLKRAEERFRKAGFHNIETHALESERSPWVKRHKESFDRVLVDAPCSGTGTWRRNPDARWRNLGPGLDILVPLQGSILQSASRLVKKGGRLVYATCSLLPDENEQQVQKFLDNNPDFKLVPVQSCTSFIASLPDTGDMMLLSPAQHGSDGFFAAVMQRQT
ncbi:MAG: RsmB/NOP family class I SAM-dependent RNA methyltransferase [Alphaproteobacteria bacterium]|jgi:16S rRNA (cytosine967-C5)-methyltransferase|nr:RsmB/NOP family class I SAM-dependent RNA methyltransferase [Alphaproteobacteria bacterium]